MSKLADRILKLEKKVEMLENVHHIELQGQVRHYNNMQTGTREWKTTKTMETKE